MNFDHVKNCLLNCQIKLSHTDGYIFESLANRFHRFMVKSPIADWICEEENLRINGYNIVIPKTAVQIKFANQSVLFVFKSGHIRYMSENGIRYYSIITNQQVPNYIQGDLVIIKLDNKEKIPHIEKLKELLYHEETVFWYTHQHPSQYNLVQIRTKAAELYIGGNRKHKSVGLLSYFYPIRYDYRTIQVKTLEQIKIIHNPTDEIHPVCYL